MSGLEEIQVVREGIGHALSDNYLTVPVYQRSYAWEEEHVIDLFHDFADAISDEEGEYFLGSIVVSTQGDKPEVVDGQQRLATATILLAAIRDYFYVNGDKKRADGIEQTYLMSSDLRTQELLPRLKLNETDNDYFINRVLKKPDDATRKALQRAAPPKDSHKRIHAAAKLAEKQIKEIVSGHSASGQGERLLDWTDYIREKARVIWVKVPDHANAFVIFETLNDRGLELSIADLLKNYLFGRSGDRLTEVQQRWYMMTGALETVSSDDITAMYIRHLWASMHGPVREKRLYSQIKKSVKSKQAAIDLAIDLADNATFYAAILNSDHEMWNKYGTRARNNIETLRLLRAEQLRPLMLAVLKNFSLAEAKKTLTLFVAWAVRFLIVGGHGGGVLEKKYAETARDVRAEKITTAKALAKEMADVVPSDSQFESEFSTARVSQEKLARYYLRAIELKSKQDPEPETVPNTEEDSVNLEHVLPENPNGNWPTFTPEMADAYVRRIGNLTILKATTNSLVGNEGFPEKVKLYKKSGFTITKSIAQFKQWGPTEIEERQKALAAIAKETWPITV